MPAITNPLLIVPFEAAHVDAALQAARLDQEMFRKEEMEWLDEHFNYFRHQIMDVFGDTIKDHGITTAEAVMAGALLGNRAVRICTGEQGYAVARQNFQRHDEIGRSPATISSTPWSEAHILQRAFQDKDLVASFMKINHNRARSTAAIAVAHLCFSEIPEVD
jgi:hypothetical protein